MAKFHVAVADFRDLIRRQGVFSSRDNDFDIDPVSPPAAWPGSGSP